MKQRIQTPPPKDIIICADDYAQNAAINSGIIALASQQRLNAISCLVNSMLWDEAALELKPFQTTCYIGLHLNLTFGQPLSAMWRKHRGEQFLPLSQLIRNAYFRQLQYNVVKAEIEAQLHVFTQTLQCYPDFIDGHQHIQQLPIVREALLAVVKEHQISAFIRNTHNDWRDYFSFTGFPKSQLIALLGGRRLRQDLIKKQITTNTSFAGIYHFKHATQYAQFFKQFLAKSKHGGIIMCHPGMNISDTQDPISRYRHHELQYLLSDTFLQDLTDHTFQLMTKPI